MVDPNVFKNCIHCGERKSLPLFKKEKARKDGTSNQCIECYQLKYRNPRAIQEPIEYLEGEVFKSLPELGDKIQVSNYGRLISHNYQQQNISKIIKLPVQNGYHRIALSIDSKKRNWSVHRLVAMAFIPNPESKREINHINGIKNDNRVENLEWCTRSENSKHAFRIGLQSNKGEKHSQSIITDLQAREIKLLIKQGLKDRQIADQFNVSSRFINRIRHNQRWSHITI